MVFRSVNGRRNTNAMQKWANGANSIKSPRRFCSRKKRSEDEKKKINRSRAGSADREKAQRKSHPRGQGRRKSNILYLYGPGGYPVPAARLRHTLPVHSDEIGPG